MLCPMTGNWITAATQLLPFQLAMMWEGACTESHGQLPRMHINTKPPETALHPIAFSPLQLSYLIFFFKEIIQSQKKDAHSAMVAI